MNQTNPYAPPGARVSDRPILGVDGLAYAGFWRRLGAAMLDALIFVPLIGLVMWLSGVFRLFHLYYFVPGVLIGLFYCVYLTQRYGGTPGQRMVDIRVAQVGGAPVGYREALLRYSVSLMLSAGVSVGAIISALRVSDVLYQNASHVERWNLISTHAPAWYGTLSLIANLWALSEFLVMLTNKRRRALQDYMAGTVVLHAPKPD